MKSEQTELSEYYGQIKPSMHRFGSYIDLVIRTKGM